MENLLHIIVLTDTVILRKSKWMNYIFGVILILTYLMLQVEMAIMLTVGLRDARVRLVKYLLETPVYIIFLGLLNLAIEYILEIPLSLSLNSPTLTP